MWSDENVYGEFMRYIKSNMATMISALRFSFV
jgi:hypothetical protein